MSTVEDGHEIKKASKRVLVRTFSASSFLATALCSSWAACEEQVREKHYQKCVSTDAGIAGSERGRWRHEETGKMHSN